MPFPVDRVHIDATEKELGVHFPLAFKSKMLESNGGEIDIGDDMWQLFPILDKSDSKRLSRTCNHIGLETKNAREWRNFPPSAIAVGANVSGDLLILLPEADDTVQLGESLHIWQHETGRLVRVLKSIADAEM